MPARAHTALLLAALLAASAANRLHTAPSWWASGGSLSSPDSHRTHSNVTLIGSAEARRLQFCPGGFACNGGCCDSDTVTCCGSFCCFPAYSHCNYGSCSGERRRRRRGRDVRTEAAGGVTTIYFAANVPIAWPSRLRRSYGSPHHHRRLRGRHPFLLLARGGLEKIAISWVHSPWYLESRRQ